MSTTAIEVDDELLNRCVVLAVDEGAKQTSAIHARQRETQTLEGLLQRHDRDRIIALHQNAQRLLDPLLVANPFAKELRFSATSTRARRDHMKYLTLIRAIALLHQHQREIKPLLIAARRCATSRLFARTSTLPINCCVRCSVPKPTTFRRRRAVSSS